MALKVENFRCFGSGFHTIFALKLTSKSMDAVWHFIGSFFEGIFKFVPFMGLWFNKFLIVIGFIAFFLWISYMSKQKPEQKFD
ncbi:MAG: hypothetical protein KA444_04590 [Bacteroidia bacterium]|nr:hypothetical protein [Bacteroidia bacterium]